MTFASLAEIKKELQQTDADVIQSLCLRLAKYKKENKELLGYLLFESQDEASYVRQIKEDIDGQFEELKGRNLYIVKKMLRKTLRYTNRHIKYSDRDETDLELRIYFCEKVKTAKIPLDNSQALFNLYQGQLKKINTTLKKLPEDLQSDYANAIAGIELS
jgi:membrane-anchored protein YejM (alkaline phosphatase superfamily)